MVSRGGRQPSQKIAWAVVSMGAGSLEQPARGAVLEQRARDHTHHPRMQMEAEQVTSRVKLATRCSKVLQPQGAAAHLHVQVALEAGVDHTPALVFAGLHGDTGR